MQRILRNRPNSPYPSLPSLNCCTNRNIGSPCPGSFSKLSSRFSTFTFLAVGKRRNSHRQGMDSYALLLFHCMAFNSIVGRSRSLAEFSEIFRSISSNEVLACVGIAIMSTAVGIQSGRILQKTKDKDKESSLSLALPEKDTDSSLSVIPSPKQIWDDVHSRIVVLVETRVPESSVQSKRRSSSKRSRSWSGIRLGLQALSISVRQQILILAFTELQERLLFYHDLSFSCESLNLEEFVIQLILFCYTSAGEKWLGYKPVYENKDDPDLHERAHEGFWKLVEEKLPVYAVIIKYLVFLPETSAAQLVPLTTPHHSSNSSKLLKSTATDLEAEMDELDKKEALGMCFQYRSQESFLLVSSAHVLEDLVLVIAELIALEYLSFLTDNKSNTLTDWPRSVKRNLRNTRTLERFRNQIFFSWWLYRNFFSVMAIFEDYHYLLGIQQDGSFIQRKCVFRRSEEFSKLKGLRLSVSYFLEALDALEPILKSFIRRLGDLISFLLVKLIGRSIGLVLKGIQSSLPIPWHNNNSDTNNNDNNSNKQNPFSTS